MMVGKFIPPCMKIPLTLTSTYIIHPLITHLVGLIDHMANSSDYEEFAHMT